MPKATAVLILDMYRSGASALAGCFRLLGMPLLENHTAVSPKGVDAFGQELARIHGQLLQDIDRTWDTVDPLPKGWVHTDAATKAGKAIAGLLRRKFPLPATFAVRDPLVCRTLPLWLSVLKEKDVAAVCVLALRHPLEVARSLRKCKGIPERQGLLLWLAYTREALVASRALPCAILTYDQLLADPLAALHQIETACAIHFPLQPQQEAVTLRGQMRSDLRHERAEAGPAGDEECCFTAMYERLCRVGLMGEGAAPNDLLRAMLGLDRETDGQADDGRGLEALPARLLDTMLSYVGDHERAWAKQAAPARSCPDPAEPEARGGLRVRVFFPLEAPPFFTEAPSHEAALVSDQWQELVFPVPHPLRLAVHGFRLLPFQGRGTAWISGLKLLNPATGEALFSAEKPSDFSIIAKGEKTICFSDQDIQVVTSVDDDPRLDIPPLPDLPDGPLELHLWIKATTSQTILQEHILVCHSQVQDARTAVDNLLAAHAQEQQNVIRQCKADVAQARQQYEKEREQLVAELAQVQQQAGVATQRKENQEALVREYHTALSKAETLLSETETALTTRDRELAETRMALAEASERLAALQRESHAAKLAADAERAEAASALAASEEELKVALGALLLERKNAAGLQNQLDVALSETQQRTRQAESLAQGHELALRQLRAEHDKQLRASGTAAERERMNILTRLRECEKQGQDRQETVASLQAALRAQQEEFDSKQATLDSQQNFIESLRRRCCQQEISRRATALALFSNGQKRQGQLDQATASQLAEQIHVIAQSALFDGNWYPQQANIAADVDPLRHYVTQGAAMGLDPHPLFSTVYYLQQNPDVAISGHNPLLHYLSAGHIEQRDPHPFFSTRYYLETNPDVAEAGQNPLAHFLLYGGAEGRNPHPLIDLEWYVRHCPDAAQSGLNPLVHFILLGEERGNDPGPFFKSRWYVGHYPDVVASELSPLAHYLLYGQPEGRRPGPDFDPAAYYAVYADVAASGLSALEHYVRFGRAEGRQPLPTA
ncbi:MAG: hypothetical protein AAGU21_12825 [Solidesulfovibrio sp.]|uniref:hypothetical protein n=1 Tax=Solidesulfovibrio sp. TaxID=2910990 RepID=UPI002B20374C|nr:hypothetical protein [Solidesulfovibrio sp.]MEA4855621.1 hypothetical protein [Solidesulfovibrio sp.]